MKRIFVPSTGPGDWQRLLAQPKKHWRRGYSAMCAAASWEADSQNLPSEIASLLNGSAEACLRNLELLAAIPEWEVDLPGGDRPSQTDVMAFARNAEGLVLLGVEAKVDEPFGPTMGEKRREASPGQRERMAFLHSQLGLSSELPDAIRYQLLHRTASALMTARSFHARAAAMIVQSFSEDGRWRDDFEAFARAVGAVERSDSLFELEVPQGPALYLAWVAGDQKFSEMNIPSSI